MLDKIINHLRKRRQWAIHSAMLDRIGTEHEYREYVRTMAHPPAYVCDSEQTSAAKRRIATTILDGYGIEVRGRRVLDIGPGYGDFLDVARERGGVTVGLDHDPFVVRWLQVRGHLACRGSILHAATPLQNQLFEVVNSIGSVVVEYFGLVGVGRLQKFLAQLERHRAPGGTILLCPFFEINKATGQRKIANPEKCFFTDAVLEAGYRVLDRLPGVHDSQMYTMTYGKLP